MSQDPREEIANRLAHMCGSLDSYSNIFVIATNKVDKDDGTKVTFFGHSDTAGDLELYGVSNLFGKLMDVYIYKNSEILGEEDEDYDDE
jgi:hypothetical protein